MREAELESFFRTRVRLLGGYTIKLAPTEAGVPDRLVIMPGDQMYLVELKTDTGKLSDIQRAWHRRLKTFGVEVVVLHGQDGILKWLRRTFDAMDPHSTRTYNKKSG